MSEPFPLVDVAAVLFTPVSPTVRHILSTVPLAKVRWAAK